MKAYSIRELRANLADVLQNGVGTCVGVHKRGVLVYTIEINVVSGVHEGAVVSKDSEISGVHNDAGVHEEDRKSPSGVHDDTGVNPNATFPCTQGLGQGSNRDRGFNANVEAQDSEVVEDKQDILTELRKQVSEIEEPEEIVEAVEEVRYIWEDGEQHPITRSQCQKAYGRYWVKTWAGLSVTASF